MNEKNNARIQFLFTSTDGDYRVTFLNKERVRFIVSTAPCNDVILLSGYTDNCDFKSINCETALLFLNWALQSHNQGSKSKAEAEVSNELEPYVWHKREVFDGNPNKYYLVEYDEAVNETLLSEEKEIDVGTYLRKRTSHFMYLERPEMCNEED